MTKLTQSLLLTHARADGKFTRPVQTIQGQNATTQAQSGAPGAGGSSTTTSRRPYRGTSTHRLSVNGLRWLPVAIQAAVHVGRVLPVEPEDKRGREGGSFCREVPRRPEPGDGNDKVGRQRPWGHIPVQVVGGLVQECVVLSNKLPPDELGTRLLHHHFFGQMEI